MCSLGILFCHFQTAEIKFGMLPDGLNARETYGIEVVGGHPRIFQDRYRGFPFLTCRCRDTDCGDRAVGPAMEECARPPGDKLTDNADENMDP